MLNCIQPLLLKITQLGLPHGVQIWVWIRYIYSLLPASSYSTRRILMHLEWPCAFHFLSVLESTSELFSLHPLEFKRVRFAETSSPYGTIGLSVYYKPSITLPDRSVIDTSNHHTQCLYVSRRPSKIGFAVLLMDLLQAIQCVCSVKNVSTVVLPETVPSVLKSCKKWDEIVCIQRLLIHEYQCKSLTQE